MKKIQDIKKVYCIGLGGIGVSAVAKLLLARGVEVSGSDPVQSPIVDDVIRLGATFFPDENPDHITPETDLVVVTDDAPEDHPLRQAAERLNIPIENFSVILGRLMAEVPQRLCVAGTNGKSTTTALVGLLATNSGLDPTVFVGSRVAEFDGNVRVGHGSLFIAEADEYRDHYLNYSPTVITLTNLEPDHLDYFGSQEKMIASFTKFVATLPASGVIAANADDPEVMKIAVLAPRMITFGMSPEANVRAVDVIQEAGQQSWTLMINTESLGRYTLHLPGQFNIMNCLAAVAGAMSVGADPSSFLPTITAFHGVWRRFQILNPKGQVTIISDYAHHPTAVRLTLEGAKKFYPGRRIVAVFQPHHQSRLTSLFDDFTKSFSAADEVIIVEAYTVPGRDIPETEVKTSRQLAEQLQAHYVAKLADIEVQLPTMLKTGDVAIIMGAGDIWRQAESLGNKYA